MAFRLLGSLSMNAKLRRLKPVCSVSPLMEPGARFARRLLAGMPLGEAAAVDGLDLTKVLAVLLSCGAFATFP